MKKQWKRASDAERTGLMPLQVNVKNQLVTLRRVENFSKRCKKKEHTRTRFYKETFSFIKDLFAKKKKRKRNLE